jgi:hypothetical protein
VLEIIQRHEPAPLGQAAYQQLREAGHKDEPSQDNAHDAASQRSSWKDIREQPCRNEQKEQNHDPTAARWRTCAIKCRGHLDEQPVWRRTDRLGQATGFGTEGEHQRFGPGSRQGDERMGER